MTWDELRSEAFGEIGIKPNDFYMMEREDYWLLHKGFFNKRVYDQRVLRNAVTIILSPWSKLSPYQIWPLPDDDKLRAEAKMFTKQIRISDKNREVLKRFKELEDSQKPKDN